jgi:hypothetical protein
MNPRFTGVRKAAGVFTGGVAEAGITKLTLMWRSIGADVALKAPARCLVHGSCALAG